MPDSEATTFGRLHPVLQHHIVNSLGSQRLRPLQAEAIEPILRGDDALLLAPTAGGKTEAAVFPLFTRMHDSQWDGLSVLYVCPLKALLNNVEPRLSTYARVVGPGRGRAARRHWRRGAPAPAHRPALDPADHPRVA